MNGTHVGDFEQTLPLFGSQISLDGQFALKFVNLAVRGLTILAILRMDFGVFDAYRRRLQIELLAHAIYVQRHRGAAREGGK